MTRTTQDRGGARPGPGRVGRVLTALLLAVAALLAAGCAAAPAPAAAPAAPDLVGDWRGRIEVPGSPLEIGVTLTADGGTFDLPAQGLADLPLADLRTEGGAFTAGVPDVPGDARFDGRVSPDGASITGDFLQAGQEVPFTLERGTLAAARPQEPQPPLPYRSEEVTVPSGDVTLAGTLTLPPGPGPFPAVVLISGSGPQDRDEALSGHRPFLVVSDALTRAGYAVLRTDDRGVGGSGGDYTQASYPVLADDALAGVSFLAARPDVDPARIGLFGHSEGGYLAPLAAQRSPGSVAFVVMMAGPAVPGEDVLLVQNEKIMQLAGAPPEQVQAQVEYVRALSARLRAGDYAGARQLVVERIGAVSATLPPEQRLPPEAVEAQADAQANPVFAAFVGYDPGPALSALSVPVLAFFGEKDVQVVPEQSVPALEGLLAGKPDVTITTLPGLNHLMQPATTGGPEEYGAIGTTIAPEALDLVTGWLRERF